MCEDVAGISTRAFATLAVFADLPPPSEGTPEERECLAHASDFTTRRTCLESSRHVRIRSSRQGHQAPASFGVGPFAESIVTRSHGACGRVTLVAQTVSYGSVQRRLRATSLHNRCATARDATTSTSVISCALLDLLSSSSGAAACSRANPTYGKASILRYGSHLIPVPT